MNAPSRPTARWWQWPTILSLDAPLVVIAWQRLFGALAGVRVGWAETAVLGASVWLGYAADRWFEGWHVAPDLMRTPRHRFYQEHRWWVAALWLLVVLADLVVAFTQLSGHELIAGALLLVPTGAYVLSHQFLHRHHPWRAPKEVCVAALLPAAASIFVFAAPGMSPRTIAAAVLFFAGLCFTNLALIAVWEQEVDESHGQVSLARQFQRAAVVSRALPWTLTALALIAGGTRTGLEPVAGHCIAASAVLLAMIDHFEPRIGRQAARVLADLALLTPLVPLLKGILG